MASLVKFNFLKSTLILGTFALCAVSAQAFTIDASGSNGNTYGANGRDAGNIDVTLSEKSNSISIQGVAGGYPIQSEVNRFGEVIFGDASGGNGAVGYPGRHGTPGRPGIPGIDGRNGRDGYPGRNGRNGTASSPDGENGQDGTPGENGTDGQRGQDGGNGENGGNGGDGGNAGDGGQVIFRSYSTDLFMHLRANYSSGSRGAGGALGMGGAAGEGGRGGYGGRGGDGGRGGEGGRGYRCSQQEIANGCHNGRDGDRGRNGRDGYNGNSGSRGFDGIRGSDGIPGRNGAGGYDGAVKLVLLNPNGTPAWEFNSLNIYRLQVLSFDLVDENQDGIFEPGENFSVTRIQVRNAGGLPSPAGAEISFVDGPLAIGSPLKLPSVGINQVFTLPDVIRGQVPLAAKPGQTFRVASEIRFRGLTFDIQDFATSFAVRYPLEIVGIEVLSTIPYNQKVKAKVMVNNISQRDHTMNLTYSQDGKFNYNVVSALTSVRANSSGSEWVEISAGEELLPYSGTNFSAQVHRANLDYTNFSKFVQVAPSYRFSSTRSILVLVDKQNVNDFKLVSGTLQHLGLDADIYDLNLNGPLGLETSNPYSGKSSAIFLSGKGHLDKTTLASLQKMTSDGSGMFVMGLNPNLNTSNYRIPIVAYAQNFFNLKPDEKLNLLTTSILDSISNLRKREHLALMLAQQNSEVLNLTGSAYIKEILREFNLARNDKGIYESPDPFIQQYNAWVTSLHPLKEIALKTYMSGYTESFLKFDHSSLESAWGKFKSYFAETREYYLNSLKLSGSCGDINGTYYDNEGHWMSFKKSWLGSIRGWDEGAPFKYKLKKAGDKNWTSKYTIQKSDYAGQITMSCENSLIQLRVTKPHLGQDAVQILTKVSVKPQNLDLSDDEDSDEN